MTKVRQDFRNREDTGKGKDRDGESRQPGLEGSRKATWPIQGKGGKVTRQKVN